MSKVVERLTSKTLFDTAGWRRIPAVHKYFKAFDLDIDRFMLEAIPVHHPNSRGLKTFQEDIMKDKAEGKLETSMTRARFQPKELTFVVRKKTFNYHLLNKRIILLE